MSEPKARQNRTYTVTLILLVGLAAFSTTMKELNRLKEMVSSVQALTGQWRRTDLTMLNVESISTEESCQNDRLQVINRTDSTDALTPAQVIEIESNELETIAEPEVGGRVELLSSQRVHPKMPILARAKYAQRNLNEELSAKRRESGWPTRIQYRTADRVVTLDLPMTIVNESKADTLDSDASSDFPLSLLGRIGRKQPHGKADTLRREFIFRKFERTNYGSRRSS